MILLQNFWRIAAVETTMTIALKHFSPLISSKIINSSPALKSSISTLTSLNGFSISSLPFTPMFTHTPCVFMLPILIHFIEMLFVCFFISLCILCSPSFAIFCPAFLVCNTVLLVITRPAQILSKVWPIWMTKRICSSPFSQINSALLWASTLTYIYTDCPSLRGAAVSFRPVLRASGAFWAAGKGAGRAACGKPLRRAAKGLAGPVGRSAGTRKNLKICFDNRPGRA